jgi:VanZ family protein
MKLTGRQKITIVALALYWIVLAFASHMRIPQIVYQAQVSDKWLHFLAYLNLIFLLWFSIRPDRKVVWRSRLVWLVLFTACAYGGFDELTQPIFGRTKDFGDFVANVTGSLTGLILFTFMTFWPSLLAALAITIFGLTNLAKADLSKLFPISDAVFHFFAYGFFALVWTRIMKQYFFYKSSWMRLAWAIGVPFGFLLVVKAGSLLLGRHFALTDLLFGAAGIITVVVVRRICYLPKGL